MKTRILALILMPLLCFVSSCSLFGGVADTGAVTVVIENSGEFKEYKIALEKVENKEEGAFGVLEALRADKRDPLHLKVEDGAFGAYITEIGDLKNSGGGYIMVYTSNKTDSYEGAPTVAYNDTTLYQAGVGVSSMTVGEGCVILFRVEVYEI